VFASAYCSIMFFLSFGLVCVCVCVCVCVYVCVHHQVQALPESAVAGTHNTAEGFRRRTDVYTQNNGTAGKKSALAFFEEVAKMEVLEVHNGGSTDLDAVIASSVQPYVEQGGTAYNYHPTEEELAAAEAHARAEAVCDTCCSPLALWFL
jgi:hypothetical protein